MKQRLILIMITLLASMQIWAYDIEVNGIYYKLNKSQNTAEVTSSPTSYSDSVNIPSTFVTDDVEYTVTSIGSDAFYKSSLRFVTIPKSVTQIGGSAFYKCSNLKSIDIPDSVTYIGPDAFHGCSGITSIVLPNTIKIINDYVFESCSALKTIVIPNSVTHIRTQAFYGCLSLVSIDIPASVVNINLHYQFDNCQSLTTISVDEGNTAYSSVDGVLMDKSKNTLLFYPQGRIGAYEIPNTVTTIADDAFTHCRNLTSVSIPNSVESIGQTAFFCCSGLTTINVPASVTSIGDAAFGKSGYMPSGITSINVDEGNPVYKSMDGVVFNKDLTEIKIYPLLRKGGYEIPNTVTKIGRKAFSCCDSLTSISIPNSVTDIGYEAFMECISLTSITIPASVVHIEDFAFYRLKKLKTCICLAETIPEAYSTSKLFGESSIGSATLIVPEVALETYKTTEPWSHFGTIIPLESSSVRNISATADNTPFKMIENGKIVIKNNANTYYVDGSVSKVIK